MNNCLLFIYFCFLRYRIEWHHFVNLWSVNLKNIGGSGRKIDMILIAKLGQYRLIFSYNGKMIFLIIIVLNFDVWMTLNLGQICVFYELLWTMHRILRGMQFIRNFFQMNQYLYWIDTIFFFRGIVLTLLLILVQFDRKTECVFWLWWFMIGYMIILVISMILEFTVAVIALKGTILDQEPRESMQYVLYVRLGKYSGSRNWKLNINDFVFQLLCWSKEAGWEPAFIGLLPFTKPAK